MLRVAKTNFQNTSFASHEYMAWLLILDPGAFGTYCSVRILWGLS